LKKDNEKGNVRAKTGGFTGVTSLAGYIYQPNGEPLVFSIMINGFTGAQSTYRRLQDKILGVFLPPSDAMMATN
jgi:D-alanyl-D-alanine carboxypeptidase/D-alanyl-D-alanine-endopeptidase (penicillin-binding protein 4)